LSQDIAILNAKTNLADRLNSRVRSQTKLYANQSGSDDNIKNRQQIEKTTRNTINDVDVAGYVVAKSETQQVNGVFRTFVMLEYSREQAADLIMERIRGARTPEQKSDFDRAFEGLDKLSE
jgi:GMP synthase PP-ATPase subunit